MPKTTRGGKAGTWAYSPPPVRPVQQVQQAQQQPQPPQPPQPPTAPPQISASYDAFLKMTEDQKADVIANARKTPVPTFLADNDLQRVLYGLKLNDKPMLVDDAVLDKMPGTSLYRNVNATNDSVNRIKYGADEIAAQVIKGSVTRVSDSGGSVHGRGVYFADSYSSAAMYGNRSGDIKQTAVIRAKLNSNARTISESSADRGVTREINSGSKLGRVLRQVNPTDRTAIWSLAKGYDVIQAYNGYHIVINRAALTASKTIKPKGSKW